jgi:hypothetical protein
MTVMGWLSQENYELTNERDFNRPQCLRLGTGPSGASLDRSLPWGKPPALSREHAV